VVVWNFIVRLMRGFFAVSKSGFGSPAYRTEPGFREIRPAYAFFFFIKFKGTDVAYIYGIDHFISLAFRCIFKYYSRQRFKQSGRTFALPLFNVAVNLRGLEWLFNS
jgi:hypothetical protein